MGIFPRRTIPTQDGQFPPKTDNSHPRLTIPTQDGHFPPKTDNSHPKKKEKKQLSNKTTGVNSSFGHIFECSCILLRHSSHLTIYQFIFIFLHFQLRFSTMLAVKFSSQ